VGCRYVITGPAAPRRISANTGTSHRSSLEASGRRIRRPAGNGSDQRRFEAAAQHTRRPASRAGLLVINRASGQAINCASGQAHGFTHSGDNANSFTVSESSCDLSSASPAPAPCATGGSLRCGHGGRRVGCVRGRIVELQQDSQRHMLPSRRSALVDWKPWAGRPRRALASSEVVNDSSKSDASVTRP
jgi:hypothetical protein